MVALRRCGIDVDIDLHHAAESGIDWTRFGAQAVVAREWVIIASSPGWRERWEGRNDPRVGAGAAAEADALRSLYAEGQDLFRRKVVLAVLPSMNEANVVPTGLHGVHRFEISSFDVPALEGLLRLLPHQPGHPAVELGPIQWSTTRTLRDGLLTMKGQNG